MVQSSVLARIAALTLLGMSAAGCEVVGGIFKAGFWVGTIVVLVLVVGVIAIVAKAKG